MPLWREEGKCFGSNRKKHKFCPPSPSWEWVRSSVLVTEIRTDFISPLFQFAFGLILSFVSFGTYLPKYRGEKTRKFHLILEIKDIQAGFRQASQFSNHSDQTFGIFNFFSIISCGLIKPLLNSWEFQVFLWTFPANILFFKLSYQCKQKRKKQPKNEKMKINKLSHFPFSPLPGKECELFQIDTSVLNNLMLNILVINMPFTQPH